MGLFRDFMVGHNPFFAFPFSIVSPPFDRYWYLLFPRGSFYISRGFDSCPATYEIYTLSSCRACWSLTTYKCSTTLHHLLMGLLRDFMVDHNPFFWLPFSIVSRRSIDTDIFLPRGSFYISRGFDSCRQSTRFSSCPHAARWSLTTYKCSTILHPLLMGLLRDFMVGHNPFFFCLPFSIESHRSTDTDIFLPRGSFYISRGMILAGNLRNFHPVLTPWLLNFNNLWVFHYITHPSHGAFSSVPSPGHYSKRFYHLWEI